MIGYKQFISELYTANQMIDVDGVLRHKYNSEGNLIHKTDEGIRNFWRWFGNSKIVDDIGRPHVIKHTTDSGEQWSEYDENKSKNSSIHGKAFFGSFEKQWDSKKVLMKLYVKSEHPLDTSKPFNNREESLEHTKRFSNYLGREHDTFEKGIPYISIENKSDSFHKGLENVGYDSHIHIGPGNQRHIAVFNGFNLKSIDNNGEFSSKSKNINI